MSLEPIGAVVAGGVTAATIGIASLGRWPGPWADNHRGRRLPLGLGTAVVAAMLVGSVVAWSIGGQVPGRGAGLLAAVLLVFGVGVVDDALPGGPRGLRGHLRALAAGRVTTGILKLFVTTGAAVVAVSLVPASDRWTPLLGVVLLAACANAWNGLDVVPGRALKWFLAAGIPLAVLGAVPAALLPALRAGLAASVAVLPLDLRERAMLGDGGSNSLGFVIGLSLYLTLPPAGLVAAAAAAVAVNLLAETATLSRLIEGIPPLAWLDRLGRPG